MVRSLTLALLTLQGSFLVPPFGYAVLMARTMMASPVRFGPLVRALLPFLGAQLLVLALVVAFPALVHLAEPRAVAKAARSDADVQRRLDSIVPIVPEDGR